ncbi:hypothetical protein LTR50_005719 [Elasticomyces elasticus]|nr:hypothetical protein LTR50_005719 [Elasticomyces elasticus]
MSQQPSYAEVVASGETHHPTVLERNYRSDSRHLNESASGKHNGTPSRSRSDSDLSTLIGCAVNDFPPEKPYSTAIDSVPVTKERKPYYPKPGDRLIDPGTARATFAPSNESPNGTTENEWTRKHQHQTVVQQHADYWDRDHDGIIWPQDTYIGIRAWGWSIALAAFATLVINVNLSYPTGTSWLPDPLFRIHLAGLHKDKHGSDSMTFDNEGRFRPQNFEDLFAKYDEGRKGGLDVWDLLRMHKGQRMAFDFFGWTASALEWIATYLLIWPDDGVMRKEDVRRVFDGSLFQWKADQWAEKQARRKGKKLGYTPKSA